MSKTVTGPDGKPRCSWCSTAPEFYHYHDAEWGFPVDEDVRLFEKNMLRKFSIWFKLANNTRKKKQF